MINKEYVLDYIKHNDFKNDFKGLKISQKGKVKCRMQFLKEKLQGKKVIHLGCVSHKSLIDIAIKNNIWAHEIISNNASKCIGIDIDEEGVELLKTNYGINNVYFSDIIDQPFKPIYEETWDYIVLGELIEHIGNPAYFLKSILNKYKKNIKNIIITTPNAFSIMNFINSFLGVERINSDHRYHFTPYTLWKVCNDANLELLEMEMLEHHRFGFRKLTGEMIILGSPLIIFYRICTRLFPMTRNTIGAVFEINSQ